MKKTLLSFLLVLALSLSLCAFAETPVTDRAGNPVTLPADPQKVVCLNSAACQTLETLGLLDRLVAVDTYSPMYVSGLDSLPQFDMMNPDIEQIAGLEPDLVIITGMSGISGDNPYQPLIDLGVCVVDIPSSTSIQGVEEDILFLADCFGMHEDGQAVVDQMQAKIDAVAAIGATITDKKTVLFEISALPAIYSFGSDTFMDEMITLIGATNVFGDQQGWLAVTEEDAVAANPDVILTNVNYLDDPVGEILARPGWENVTAVAEGQVYAIDNTASSLANEHIVDALVEMALAVYPDAYAELAK